MSEPELFEESQEIKDLFKQVLGSDITIIDNIDDIEEELLLGLIKKLERSVELENSILNAGVDLSEITDPLHFVIEMLFRGVYGDKIAEVILFYLFERIDDAGDIIPLIDPETEKEYFFKDAKEVSNYIKILLIKTTEKE